MPWPPLAPPQPQPPGAPLPDAPASGPNPGASVAGAAGMPPACVVSEGHLCPCWPSCCPPEAPQRHL